MMLAEADTSGLIGVSHTWPDWLKILLFGLFIIMLIIMFNPIIWRWLSKEDGI